MLTRLNIMKHGLGHLFANAIPLLETFAPTIAGTLAGPPGFAAGYIIPILAHAFNALPKNATDIVKNIVEDKDVGTKLQDLETIHAHLLLAMSDHLGNLSEAEINIKLSWDNSDAVKA